MPRKKWLAAFTMWLLGLVVSIALASLLAYAQPPAKTKIYAPENLVAWCIVPFDAKNRSPEDRADMLKRLGFRRYAYDWRAEHLPTFDRELAALKKNNIELTAVWFPAGINKDARVLLGGIAKHGLKTQLWVTMNGGDIKTTPEEQKKRVAAHAAAIKPIAEEAAKIGCTVALYNHGGWFGEPENQIEIIEALKLPNIGIVYNQHHGHDHLPRFAEMLQKMKPHLLALNLNGMVPEGDRKGKKILVLGQGDDVDVKLLKTIRDSGYTGPIGILGHTSDDAEERLRDNLDGLAWLLPQLDGAPAAQRVVPRTMKTSAPPASNTPGWLAEGKDAYRTPPITIEVKAKLKSKAAYNILIASDTKASSAHWELFTTPGNGHFTAYMPGLKPDHVHGKTDIADNQWHVVAMQLGVDHVKLFVDGKIVAEQAVAQGKPNIVPASLAFARLVEGSLGCNGDLAWARISKGIIEPAKDEPAVDASTIGFWKFTPGNPAADLSPQKNTARIAAATPASPNVQPPDGPNLKAVDPTLKTVLIDRSPNDAYMAVRPDGAGRLFVGGREAVFVFEPDDKGGFRPRQQLLKLPQDSIVIGIEYRGDDLYVQTVNALYLVPGGRVKRENLQPRRLVWGVPQDLHVSFHCLAWGPQGDLYLNHGDPLLGYGDWTRPDHFGHWTLHCQPEGTKIPYTGSGAVLRVKPDGSGLKVVATGLRGPVGLAFDRDWNLFTNDNDHESMADRYAPCRLLHVTPHIDFGWPRGWMASKSPGRSDLIEPVNSTMGRGVPCDQIVYDEPMIPSIANQLLLCRWDRYAVTRFPLRPRGASFQAEEIPFITGTNNCRPTGIAADRAGRLFVTAHYLGGNVVSPHCVSDLVMIASDNLPAAELGDEATASKEDLWKAISSPSGEARRRAHNELLRRGGDVAKDAKDKMLMLAKLNAGDLAATHLPWLVASDAKYHIDLWPIAMMPRSTLSSQSLRVLVDYPTSPPVIFAKALEDSPDLERLTALSWYMHPNVPQSFDLILRQATRDDPYLRQTAANLLARREDLDVVESLAKSADAPTRLAGVLAAGIRLTVPPVHEKPPADLPLSYPKGSSFFHRELKFLDAAKPVDLADLGPIGSYTMAQRWKTIKPTAEQSRLFDLLMRALDDPSSPVKSQAAYYLGLLRDPRSEPKVELALRELRGGGLAELAAVPVKSAWLAGPFSGIKAEHPPERAAIDLSAAYPPKRIGWDWSANAAGHYTAAGGADGVSFAYFRVHSRSRQPALLTAAGAVRVWHNGRPVVATSKEPALLDLQPGSNDVLVRVHGDTPLSLALRAKEPVTAEAPEKTDGSLLAERLKASDKIPAELLAVDWNKEARTGDVVRGRKLFGSLGCMKCHAITPDQAGGGAPSLADAGRRFTPAYVVESILAPDKQVAVEFRTTQVNLISGQTINGLAVRESAEEIELLLPDTSRRVVKTADIEQRTVLAASPMPPALVRTADELRDLLTYLLSDRPTPP